MSFLIDASGLINVIRELGENSVERLKGEYSIQLIYYEVGNALWKECSILGKINLDEASKTLNFIVKLLSKMNVIHQGEEAEREIRILERAVKLNLTYYDSAYLTASETLKAILVTDDQKLRGKARKIGIKAISSKEFIEQKNSKRNGKL